jgi:tRNA threonylcarbamoyladenosine biosynthesis protein TsaB
MKVLGIHSTSPHLGVSVVEQGRMVAERVLPPGRQHLENLGILIRDLTADAGLTLRDLSGFGVAVGPGSFSGIRIGLAMVKGMALALGKPVVGISSLEALAWQSLEEGEVGTSVIDAARGEVYVAIYRKTAGCVELLEGPLLTPAANLSLLERRAATAGRVCTQAVSLDISSLSPAGPQAQCRLASPSAVAFLALERFSSGKPDDLHALSPLYIRRSDAEEKRLSAGIKTDSGAQ